MRMVFPSDGETYPKGVPSPAKGSKGKFVEANLIKPNEKDTNFDEEYFDEGDEEMVSTISIIPTKYLGEYEKNPSEDYDLEDEEAFAFICEVEEVGCFKRPTEKQRSYTFYHYILAA
ncbi:uncharacterized protein DS421_8g248050 [Arachis hypogaea]|nr:uncharacterized protein DS421_8g248050 [Arachis hypogaea]